MPDNDFIPTGWFDANRSAVINVSLLLATVLGAITLGASGLSLYHATAPSNRLQPSDRGLWVGDTITGSLPRITSTASTLILAIRVGCPFCKASIPFYRSLGASIRSDHLSVNLVAVLPDSNQQAATFLTVNGIAVHDLWARSSWDSLRVNRTPTLILTDKNRTVTRIWQGQLDPTGELEVVEAIRAAGSQGASAPIN